MYNVYTNKFYNVLICINKVKAKHKRTKKLKLAKIVKSEVKNVLNDAISELSSKNSYQLWKDFINSYNFHKKA